MDRYRTPRDVIEAFGGASRLAAVLGCRPSAVSNWHQSGIPKSRWPDLIEAAPARRVRGLTVAVIRRINADLLPDRSHDRQTAPAPSTSGRRFRARRPSACPTRAAEPPHGEDPQVRP